MEENQQSVVQSGQHFSRGQLQRRFRQFENERRARKEMHTLVPRLHQQQIEKLKNDSTKKRWNLFLQSETLRHKCISSRIIEIAKLQDEADWFHRHVETEKMKLHHIEKKTEEVVQYLLEKRKANGGVDAKNKHNAKLERKIKNHENLLDKALVKFNEASNSNQQLKDVIDYLRRERQVFDAVQDKMLREIRKKSRVTSSMIEQSENLEKEAKQYEDQMASMKGEIDSELLRLENRWIEISQQMMNDRTGINELVDLRSKDVQGKSPLQVQHRNEEQVLKTRIQKAELNVKRFTEEANQARHSLKQQKEAAELIQKATQVENIDTLVDIFINSEEENYRLYSQVNSIQENIEEVEESTIALKQELDNFSGQATPNTSRATSIIQSLKQKLCASEEEIEKNDNITAEATKSIDTICEIVGEMIQRLDIHDTAEAQVLKFSGINDSTISEYLGMIEQYTAKHLAKFVQANLEGDASSMMPHNIEHAPINFTLPSIMDSDDDEGHEDESDIEPIQISVEQN